MSQTLFSPFVSSFWFQYLLQVPCWGGQRCFSITWALPLPGGKRNSSLSRLFYTIIRPKLCLQHHFVHWSRGLFLNHNCYWEDLFFCVCYSSVRPWNPLDRPRNALHGAWDPLDRPWNALDRPRNALHGAWDPLHVRNFPNGDGIPFLHKSLRTSHKIKKKKKCQNPTLCLLNY